MSNHESRESIEEKVKKLIVSELSVDEAKVTSSASFTEDLKVDSLDIVELVMSLEDEFGLEISDEDAQKMKTVGDVIQFIMSKQVGSA